MVTKISGGWHKGRSVYNPAANRLEAGTARMFASAKWQRPEWRAQLCETIAENWLEGRSLPRAICTSVREAIAEIVRLETQAIELPQLASHSPTDVLIYRGRLNALAEFANRADPSFAIFAASLGKIFTRIAEAIPETIARDTSPFTVPLIDLIEDPAQLVAGLASDLLRLHPQNPTTILPGAVLAAETKNALLKFNKTTEEAARKNPFKIISPQASGLTGTALVKAFLPEPFATLLAMPVPFVIPLKTWASHGVAFAPPNHGKSQLLSTVAKMFLDQPDPPGFIFLDPHGDVFKKLLRLDVFHPQHGRLKDRLVIFDAADEVNGPPKMNFLDTSNSSAIGAKSAFKFLMASLSAEWSPKQEAVAGYIFKLLQRIDGASIDTLRQLLDDKARSATASAFAAAIQALPEFDRDFFANQFFDARMAETKTAMGWKIYAALDNETFRAMFSATHNSFNAYSIMQNKKICLVNGSQKTLGTDGMAVFLQFIVAQCYAASFRRGDLNEEDRHLSLMLVDEAAYVYTAPIIGNVLRECRKFGLGFFAATQLIESIPSEVKAAIFGATAIRFAGPVQDGEAAALAREMFCDKQFIRSMRSFERSRSEWALHVEGVTGKRAIRVTHPLGLLEAAPKMTEPQVTEVRARNHAYLTASEKKPQSSAPAAVPAPMETQPAPSSKIPPGTPWNSATEEEV